MLKLFRKIRQNLLSESKFSKYLLYAIGEIILVVIGILIALQINAWSQYKKERLAEQDILTRMERDLQSDLNNLTRQVVFNQSMMDDLQFIGG